MKTLNAKFRHRTVTKKGIVFGLIVSTVPAWAVDITRFTALSAQVDFSSTDSTGCIATDVFVFASEAAIISHNPPGPPDSPTGEPIAEVHISQFDFCNNIQLVDAFCLNFALADGEFQVFGDLNSATLNTTLSCDTLSDVSVALTWTAVGDRTPANTHFHIRTPGFIANTHTNGPERSAVASGSISDVTTNFTPKPSDSGTITSSKNGTVIID
jgi:hypothetical protein